MKDMASAKNGADDDANPTDNDRVTDRARRRRPNWTVEEALEDGQAAVKRGSGLPLRPSAEKALFDHYRPFFEDKWKAGDDWHAARGHIMMLSQFVGALACLLTILKNFVNKRSAPTAVDATSAVQAAEAVSWVSKLCRTGGWCPTKEMSVILEEILTQDLATRLHASKLSADQAAQLKAISDMLK